MERKQRSKDGLSYLEYLDTEDLDGFEDLLRSFSEARKSRKGLRAAEFNKKIEDIKAFCLRNTGGDWKRCLVCGIAWDNDNLIINTRQLSKLLGTSCSAINGSLKMMGYRQLQSGSESFQVVSKAIPKLKNDYNELKKWTIRQNVQEVPLPNVPRVDLNSYDKPPVRIEGSPKRLQNGLSMVPVQENVCPLFSIDPLQRMPWEPLSDASYLDCVDDIQAFDMDEEGDLFDTIEEFY